MRELVVVLGIPIDNLQMGEALDRIEAFVDTGRVTGQVHQITTVNADFVVNALRDAELRFILQNADMATADGMPLVWGSRLLGVPMRGRLAGADLVPALAERAAQKGMSIYLLGAAPGIADSAAEILKDRYPGLKIVGVKSPPYASIQEMDPSIVDEINVSQPDILFVAFGNPKQEKWISMYRNRLRVPVAMGVGGSLDFITGNIQRAPIWMQQSGLEWFHRFLQEPRRLWRRYVVDIFIFSILFFRQWFYLRDKYSFSSLLPQSDVIILDEVAIIKLSGRITIVNCQEIHNLGETALQITKNIIIDLDKVSFVDSAAIGTLVNLAKKSRQNGGDLVVSSASPRLRKTFSILKLDSFFVRSDDIDSGIRYLKGNTQTPVLKLAFR